MKQFKAESKKLLDMMINSIYTHKEIFLRELISNASDAIDKLYYRSLTDGSVTLNRSDYAIDIKVDRDNRIVTVSDNGCGMTADELEKNLGTIAKSGSLDFKNANGESEDISVIGQFGVGFYSAFMVSDRIEVESKPYGSDEANLWVSAGVDGYTVEPCEKESNGTTVRMHIKADSESENYSEFLETYRLEELIKKYSDYIRYPIRLTKQVNKKKEDSDEYESVTEVVTVNSMIPLWKKSESDVKKEEYESFYRDKFYDYEPPLKVVRASTEGTVSYTALLFIPSHAPYNYYTRDFEKGLQLYSSGVMIMERCADLLPDYFSFVSGLVDSDDLSLNISREMLQHDRQLKLIAKNLEKKIKNELQKMLENDRETYEKFWKAFGLQIKYGVYSDFGMHKDELSDLLLFTSSDEKKLITLSQYVDAMKEDQKEIYYACGETADKISLMPKTELLLDKGYQVLYLTEDVDEFCLRAMDSYKDKKFVNIASEELKLDDYSEDAKKALEQKNDEQKDLLAAIKEALPEVFAVRFTDKLKNHPVCLASEGQISLEMEKVMAQMPVDQKVKAQLVLEINASHPIAQKLADAYESDKEKLCDYAKMLYVQARLIEGLPIENPTEYSLLVSKYM